MESRKFLFVNYGNTDIHIHNISMQNTTNIAYICEMSVAYSTEHTVNSRFYLRHPQATHTTIQYCICYNPRGYYNDGFNIHSIESKDCNADYNINHSHFTYTCHLLVLFLTTANAPHVCTQQNPKPLVLSKVHLYNMYN
jgi:hypothetical protein